MKRFAALILLIFTLITLSACTNDKKADIVTTMFPQYDFARQIVGDKMTVSLLIPPGAEIHDYEATSKDMVAIKEAKLFIFTSLDIDTWIKNPESIGGKDTIVLNLSESFNEVEHDHHHDTHLKQTQLLLVEDDHDHDHDLHFWTDPLIAIQLIEAILEKIIEIDPENQAYYEANAHEYIHEIEELHEEIDTFFQLPTYKDSTIFFAGHNAMGAFGERYHIEIISLFENFKPDADLTSAELTTFINQVLASGTHFLFIEELVEPKAANKIKLELQNRHQYPLTLLELHGYHNITRSEMEAGVSYYDLLSRNFENLKIALGASQIEI